MSVETTLTQLELWQTWAEALPEELTHHLAEQVKAHIDSNWSGSNPSAEGDPPAIITGNLAESIRVEAAEGGYRVGSGVSYAALLEFGSGRMGARPWLRPALESVRGSVVGTVREFFARNTSNT